MLGWYHSHPHITVWPSHVGKCIYRVYRKYRNKYRPCCSQDWIVTPFIIRLTHANVWESMGKPCSCMQFIKSRIFYYKSRKNPYQYYQSRENLYQYCKSHVNPLSGTASHMLASKTEGAYDNNHSTKLYREKNITLCCRWHCYSCCALVTIQTATNS